MVAHHIDGGIYHLSHLRVKLHPRATIHYLYLSLPVRTDNYSEDGVYALFHNRTRMQQTLSQEEVIAQITQLGQPGGMGMCAVYMVYTLLWIVYRLQQAGGESSDIQF